MRAFSLGWRLAFLAIFAFEAVNAASGIHNVLFAGVERVGLAADINAHQRVFFTVGSGDGLFGFHGGFGQEGEISAIVLENYRTVVRVDVFFHGMSPKNSVVWLEKPRDVTGWALFLQAIFAGSGQQAPCLPHPHRARRQGRAVGSFAYQRGRRG